MTSPGLKSKAESAWKNATVEFSTIATLQGLPAQEFGDIVIGFVNSNSGRGIVRAFVTAKLSLAVHMAHDGIEHRKRHQTGAGIIQMDLLGATGRVVTPLLEKGIHGSPL